MNKFLVKLARTRFGILLWRIRNELRFFYHQYRKTPAIDSSSSSLAAKQIFVDISELVRVDAKSGIQRVVRNILREWLIHPIDNVRIEPVYATVHHFGYHYAQSFTSRFLGNPNDPMLKDKPIEYKKGDIFIGLDFQPHIMSKQKVFYRKMQRHGVKVYFVIHDLLPIQMSQYFSQGASESHTKWLRVIRNSDGLCCVSKAVLDEVKSWLEKNSLPRRRPLSLAWFHHGADLVGDIKVADSSHEFQGNEQNVLNSMGKNITFLMVGTMEPRKGHAQTLAAFEQLWREGLKVVLVIVGKQGWMVDDLIKKINQHAELNKRLFWLDGITDYYLDSIYRAATCLIAASYGEGFGIPLIEAAQYKIPIIARDIPVFKEVTAGHAFYFKAEEPQDLAQAIKEWILLYEENAQPKSDTMPWQSWRQSANHLFDIITSG